MKTKKMQILGALAVGVAGGFAVAVAFLSSGCGFLFLATAKADNSVMVPCSAQGHATNDYPGLTPEQFAGISAVEINGSKLQPLSPSADGDTVDVKCAGPQVQVLFSSR